MRWRDTSGESASPAQRNKKAAPRDAAFVQIAD
jgi:hypothetical protein